MKKKLVVLLLIASVAGCWFAAAFAAYPPVRIKDIAHVLEARENQLMGFGLVVGLKRTGDSTQTGFTKQALTNLLNRLGVTPQDSDFRSKNVAAVMVTAMIPPFMKPGQKLDVVVASVGDASSLKGGTLLQTPLMGADNKVYAVSQGQLLVGEGAGGDYYPNPKSAHTTTALIPNGALIEKEIPVDFDQRKINVVLDKPDFTTAVRVADSIQKIGFDAKAIDAATVFVPYFKGEDMVRIVSKIEMAVVVPDIVAKVVINEKTGIVVIGENVRMAPVAVAYRGFTVRIGTMTMSSSTNISGAEIEENAQSDVSAGLDADEKPVKALGASTSIADLVSALNSLGASPKDLIAILQAIKRLGALPADIEVVT